MKNITFRVPDDMVPLLEEWVKHIPEMEVVSLIESTEYGLDDMNLRMALALKTLKQNGAIRHGYDYTWIMVGIGDGAVKGLGGFKSPQRFMDYLKSLPAASTCPLKPAGPRKGSGAYPRERRIM